MNVYLISRSSVPTRTGEYVAAVVVAPDEGRAREEAFHLSEDVDVGVEDFLRPDIAVCEHIGIGRGPVRVVLESMSP